MRITGRKLSKEWGISAEHALYHHNGDWYHHLERFPGVLFDPNGYVRFKTREEYLSYPGLVHGEHLHVNGGIRTLVSYVLMKG